jgi:hypothetical protein
MKINEAFILLCLKCARCGVYVCSPDDYTKTNKQKKEKEKAKEKQEKEKKRKEKKRKEKK